VQHRIVREPRRAQVITCLGSLYPTGSSLQLLVCNVSVQPAACSLTCTRISPQSQQVCEAYNMYSAERGGLPPVISAASMQRDMSFSYGRESRWLPWHPPSQPATLESSDLRAHYHASYQPSSSLRWCRYSSGHVTSDVEEMDRATDETINQTCRIRIERLSERALSQHTSLNQGKASLDDSDDSDEEPYKNFKDDGHRCKRCNEPFWEWRLNQDACEECQRMFGMDRGFATDAQRQKIDARERGEAIDEPAESRVAEPPAAHTSQSRAGPKAVAKSTAKSTARATAKSTAKGSGKWWQHSQGYKRR
jgi:hypothetical protein